LNVPARCDCGACLEQVTNLVIDDWSHVFADDGVVEGLREKQAEEVNGSCFRYGSDEEQCPSLGVDPERVVVADVLPSTRDLCLYAQDEPFFFGVLITDVSFLLILSNRARGCEGAEPDAAIW
jgi:hypothetical protein